MRLAVAAVLLVTLPGRAHAVGLADDLRALGWLWPPVAAVIVVALALWHVARAMVARRTERVNTLSHAGWPKGLGSDYKARLRGLQCAASIRPPFSLANS